MTRLQALVLRFPLIIAVLAASGCSLLGHGPRDVTEQVRQDAARDGMRWASVGFVPGRVYRLTRDARWRADEGTLNWVDDDPARRPVLNSGDLDIAAGTHFRVDQVIATDSGVDVDYECRGVILDGAHAGRRFSNVLLPDAAYVDRENGMTTFEQ